MTETRLNYDGWALFHLLFFEDMFASSSQADGLHDKAVFICVSPLPSLLMQVLLPPVVGWRTMGKAFAKLFGKKDMRILMLGLDAAGKTSILPSIACQQT